MATIGLVLIAVGAWIVYFSLHGSPLLPITPSGAQPLALVSQGSTANA